MRRGLIGALVAGLVATPLAVGFTAAPAQAASAGLVINEVYVNGGSSGATYTHRFVELRNVGSTPVNFATTPMSLQYRAPGSSGNSTFAGALTSGTVAPNGYFLIQGASNGSNGAALTGVDATLNGFNGGGAGGTVSLVTGTSAVDPASSSAVVDKLGYGSSNSPEGSAPTGNSVTKSLARTGLSTDTDNNVADFAAQDPTPDAINVGGTNPGGNNALSATDPGAQTATVNQPFSLQLQASGGTEPRTWTAPTLPAGLTITSGGLISGTPTATGSTSVTATVTDAATPTPASQSVTFTITVNAAQAVTPIATIQGTGTATTLPSNVPVTTEGVVTAAYPTRGLNGFYIQTPGADTPNASDAIFVYGGPTGFSTYPAVGDSVRVVGTPGEFSNQTQLTATSVTPVSPLGTVTPKTTIPGTDCAEATCPALADLAVAREAMEGELLKPTAPWTVTDAYDYSPFWPGTSTSSGHFGEIGVAAGTNTPLVTPTELYDAQDEKPQITARTNYNNARRIILDDGSSLNFTAAANTGTAFPWLTDQHTVRVGAAVTFPEPVVFTHGFNGTWRILPSTPVTGVPSATQPQIEQTRAANTSPQDVGGDVKLATFNVLNFFPTTGNEYVSSGLGQCTYFTDRQGAQITNNRCGSPAASDGNGPRGAANTVNLERQRAKIVAAINGSGADIVSLEELENSVKFGKDRDFAINALVTALNDVAGAGTWAAVASPSAANLPTLAEQDVIRNGFIYKPAAIALVGPSVVLSDESSGVAAFEDAREPLAQAFKAVGSPDADAFAVIVNHFKSKGSGTPDPDGQGNANDRRKLQAESLATFADEFKTARGISRVFLAGDFNAYSHEDPIQILEAAGYTNLESTTNPAEKSYNFDGQVGSLDHVLANSAALGDVAGVDIWEINGNESVYYEYSRFNYNVTNLYTATPFKSSDHNPEIVGINVGDPEPATRDIQVLATNDFHGRILNNAAGAPGSPTGTPQGPNTSADASAGAAILSGAVKQLRAQNPDTVFAAAGDLIGASTFESFIQDDEPTIDALNEATLEVSAAGNHEFDKGYEDLVGRVKNRADWEYIAANVQEPAGRDDLAESWTKDFGSVKVGFVGAVTEDLPTLVAPGGIRGVTVTDIVTATNAEADALKAAGADVIVLLVHEGAPSTSLADSTTNVNNFSEIVNGVNANIDAIVSGHTHLAYNHSVSVPAWVSEGRAVTERPVVSAGQYGQNLNRLVFTVDTATGEVTAKTQAVLPLKANAATPNYPSDPAVEPIVNDAITEAAVLGAEVLGQTGGVFSRAKLANGTTENRGGESTLGNLVAEIQRWATRNPESGAADVAFMNPGGLRADLVGNANGAARDITFRQAAEVQPFANTLVNMDLTGAQIEEALEQQWQPAGASRPFLKLGISKGFTYTYVPPAAGAPAGTKGEVIAMYLDGEPIADTDVLSVTVNSFLSTGGDGVLSLRPGGG